MDPSNNRALLLWDTVELSGETKNSFEIKGFRNSRKGNSKENGFELDVTGIPNNQVRISEVQQYVLIIFVKHFYWLTP